MAYNGPKNIVILGGGIAGLAAADAVSEALHPYAVAGTLPPGMSVTVVEGEAQLGGRATTWNMNGAGALDPAEPPPRPPAGHSPHGIHFTWHSYEHFLRFARDSVAAGRFSPSR